MRSRRDVARTILLETVPHMLIIFTKVIVNRPMVVSQRARITETAKEEEEEEEEGKVRC